jgi:hypothetical protein
MEVSRGTAYGLGLSQCLATLGVVLFSPPGQVYVFTAHAEARNGTISLACPGCVYGASVRTGLPVLAASGLAAVFSTVTYRMREDLTSVVDFQPDTLEQLGLWESLFWTYTLAMHAIVAAVIASPVDAFGCLSASCFMGYFLYRACVPKGPAVNLTQENLNIMGYCAGALLLGYQIPAATTNGVTVLMCMVLLDYFLGIGHTWDREATLDTVTNCRLFYICCGTLGTACLYATGA